MTTAPFPLLPADDDPDDSFFFEEALGISPIVGMLSSMSDGVQLRRVLSDEETPVPDAIFLEMNLPLKKVRSAAFAHIVHGTFVQPAIEQFILNL